MEVQQVRWGNPTVGVRPVGPVSIASLALVGVLLVLLTGCAGTGSSEPDNPGGVIVQRAADPGGFVGGTSLPQPYALPDQVFTDTAKQSFNLAHSPSTKVTLVFFRLHQLSRRVRHGPRCLGTGTVTVRPGHPPADPDGVHHHRSRPRRPGHHPGLP